MRRLQETLRFSEIYTMSLAVLDKEREAARARMLAAAGRGGRARAGGDGTAARPGKVSRAFEGRTRDRVAARFGISGRQLEKIGDVVRAAEADPARFGGLLEEMDRSGKVNGPHTKLLRLQDAQRVGDLVPVAGRFRTLVMDVPWDEDNISAAAGHDYALMSFEQILGLRALVDSWADPSFCHLWFWATNNATGLAHQALEHYGFRFKISHIWRKPNYGRGRYARNTHETVLFAMRGDQACQPAWMSTPTVHDWGRADGPESSKPEGFYAMVRALSYGPFGEAFQRQARPDFVNLYQPARAPRLEAAE